MANFFENSIDSLGTAHLLLDLNNAQHSLGAFNASSPELDATDLLEQVKDLVNITTSINDLAIRNRRSFPSHPESLSASDLIHLHSVLVGMASITEECTMFITTLQSSLKDLSQERIAAGYITPESRLGNQTWYGGTYQALKLQTEVLRTLFSAINLLHHKNDTDENGKLSTEARSFATTLHYQIALVYPKLHATNSYDVTKLQSAVAAAKAVEIHVPASTNKHFVCPRSPKSFYTGRESQMAKLKAAFEDTTVTGQKIFVIYGLGGSGKTEIALKYAEENLDKFWGVFFVDGSSRKNASGSYAEIATIGGVQPNEKAAKNWLITRDLPWLLIVDNVDDDEVQPDDLLPLGTKGYILITSRNPAHKTYGNVGKRYLELLPMGRKEANELILKAAEEPSPWQISVTDSASTICQALGFLPLALVHAAKAILLGLCSWSGYLSFYESQIQRIRRERLHRRDRSLSRNRRRFEEDGDSMNVFSSYEILYQSLESSQEERFQDAVELLHIFSFLHFQNIRFDTLINAATNPFKEAEQRKKEAREDETLQKKLPKQSRKSWSMWYRELSFFLKGYLDTPPPLPAALKNPDGLTQSAFEGEVNVRLSEALAILIKRSLVVRQDRVESRYSMHPLVHKWVRERPELLTSHQSLWCQVAMTTLAKSILRPPLGDTDNERSTRRELLPHIIHVRACQAMIKERLQENRTLRKPFWPPTESKFGRLEADGSARFSRVYSECGLFNEALQLQSKTRAFVIQMLGEDHPLSIRLTLFVSGTLWELSRLTEATQLQRRAHQVCIESLGEDHPLTLEVTDLLASALLFKGRQAEAFTLHQGNVEKMGRLYGEDHEKTSKAIRNLGRVYTRRMEYEKATELHQTAWKRMKERLGETHLETLFCLEDLAMSYLRHADEHPDPLAEEHLRESHKRMIFVLEQRRKTLGEEHPYALLACFYLAQLKSAMGHPEEAKRMMREVITVAERNVGEKHSVVLAAKAHYARVLSQLGQYQEAEEIFHTLMQKPQYRRTSDEDGDHPDRLAAMWFLVECLEKQERLKDALEVCEEMVVALREIGGNGLGAKHKFALRLGRKVDELRGKVGGDEQVLL